jgi:hypothetical protein
LSRCATCHAPSAPGRTPGIETSLDFSTQQTAYSSLVGGRASGLTGVAADCNGAAFVVPFVPSQSLLIAVLDPAVRAAFLVGTVSGSCSAANVSDEAQRLGTPVSAAVLQALSAWVEAGAQDD